MTVSAVLPFVTRVYTGPGAYTFPFLLYDASDLYLFHTSIEGVITILTSGDFNGSTLAPTPGGTVNITTLALPSNGVLSIRRSVPYSQTIDWVNNEAFNMEILERSQDEIVMMIQQISAEVHDAASAVTWKGLWTDVAPYSERQLVEAANGNWYSCVVAHDPTLFAADLAAGYWVLALDLVAVTALRDQAAASAASSYDNAVISISHAGIATTKAGEAADSAGAALASEGIAEAKADEASASAASAANTLDAFDDRYLGAKSSDPSTDNDGGSLLTGALYFNTVVQKMKVYSGSEWRLAASSIEGMFENYAYIATQGQTTFSAMYDVGFVFVFVNGIRLAATDYTATGGSSVVLSSGLNAGDVVEIQVFGAFELANVYTRTEADALAKGKNAIIDGGFSVWIEGTSQTSSGYGSDTMWLNANVGSTKTHSRQAFTLGQTAVPGNPKAYSRTVVASVAGASNYAIKAQKIEGVHTFAGETATLSFWAKADANKNIAVEFEQVFGTGGSPSASVNTVGVTKLALTTTWTKYTVTVAIPSISGKVLGTNNNDALVVNFWFDAGSTFNARTDSLGQQSGTFDIAQVQLEKGSVATEFERLKQSEINGQVARYYFTTACSFQASMGGHQPTNVRVPKMAVAPSIRIFSPNGTTNMVATLAAPTSDVGTVTTTPTIVSDSVIHLGITGLTDGTGYRCGITLDARL